MSIIKKGRVFGKINIIDFLIVLVILLFIGGMAGKVALKYVKSPIVKETSNSKVEYFNVKVTDVLPEVANSVRLRERLCNNEDKIDAWVVKVKKMPASYIIQNPANGEIFQKENPYKKDLIVTVKAKVDSESPYTKVGVQTANIGSPFTIKTKHVYLKGTVIKIKRK